MEMIKLNYYEVKDAIKGIGRAYPQIQTIQEDSPIDDIRKYFRKIDTNYLPEVELVFDRFIMEKSAKLTDSMSEVVFGGDGRVFSDRIIHILSKFKIPPYKVYKALIQKRNTEELYKGYNFFMVEKLFYKYLSFNYYEFIDVTDLKNKIPVSIKNLEEYEYLKFEKKRIIRIPSSYNNKFVFTSKFPIEIDLFVIGRFDFTYYVSERLMTEFLEEKITGIDFEKAENLYCEI